MTPLINWDAVTERVQFPGFHGRFVHTGRMTFVLWRIEAGAVLPLHHHPHEQVVHVFSGELELTVAGERMVLAAGTVLAIPPDAPHEGVALSECRVLDAFAPVRENYLSFGPSLGATTRA